MLIGLMLLARTIIKPQLDAKLELQCSIINCEIKRSLASSSEPEEDDLIKMLVEEVPLVLREGKDHLLNIRRTFSHQ